MKPRRRYASGNNSRAEDVVLSRWPVLVGAGVAALPFRCCH